MMSLAAEVSKHLRPTENFLVSQDSCRSVVAKLSQQLLGPIPSLARGPQDVHVPKG